LLLTKYTDGLYANAEEFEEFEIEVHIRNYVIINYLLFILDYFLLYFTHVSILLKFDYFGASVLEIMKSKI